MDIESADTGHDWISSYFLLWKMQDKTYRTDQQQTFTDFQKKPVTEV
jgi:hypothetical protein